MKERLASTLLQVDETTPSLDPSLNASTFLTAMLEQFPALQKLTNDEKSALADELWLDAMSDDMPVSEEHKRLLDERWQAYKSGKAKTITLEEMERRLARK